jgi:hypothetical protein
LAASIVAEHMPEGLTQATAVRRRWWCSRLSPRDLSPRTILGGMWSPQFLMD